VVVTTSHLRRATRLATALVALAIVATALAAPASASAAIRLGVFNPGGPSNEESASAYLQLVGRQADIAMWYQDFGHTLMTSEERSALRASGQIPMVTWEPHEQSLSGIAGGGYDSYLRESARLAREWGGELMIRFAHEMNGTWYPWAGSPSTYVAAWRHIVTVFREEGATNVRWVWAPNVDRSGSMPFSAYFPGDSWVDYVALDGYNWGETPGNHWSSLREVFASSYATLTSMSAKPVIISETSSSEVGGDKAAWIRTGLASTIPHDFPRVSAVVWFNKSQEDDWRINSSDASLEAFREVANCSLYGGPGLCPGAEEEVGETTAATESEPSVEVEAIHVTKRVKAPHSHRPHGTVSYRLTRRARVRIRVQHSSRRHGRRRLRTIRIRRPGHRGRNRVALRVLLRHRHLAKGRYRLVVVASDRRGHRSRPRVAHFRVLR
jgi:hypothetical protein